MTKPLYNVNEQYIYKTDIAKALGNCGVKKGDVIFVHSDISAFGKLSTPDAAFLLKALLDSLKESVGSNGTIIMPTFTYSFTENKPYDKANSKSKVGILTEYFRKQPGVSRTIHADHSVAIWGKQKDELLNIGKDTFGNESIFGKLHKLNGKIVFFGAPFQSCTFVHHIEQMHKVPYRYMKKIRGKIIDGNKEYEDEITFYVKYVVFFTHLSNLEKHLLGKKLLKEAKVGHGKISMVEADAFFKEGQRLLDNDIFFFLKNEPRIFRIFNKFSCFFLKKEPKILKSLNEIIERKFFLNQ